jgi:Ca2+-transporting ATPase
VDGLQRSPDRAREIERAVRAVDGVQSVQPSTRTGNVLIRFDAARCSAAQLVQAASRRLGLHAAGAAPPDGTTVVRSATPGRLRLGVAGLRQRPDRVPLVIEALSALPGVARVGASAATGTALVHYEPSDIQPARLRAESERVLSTRFVTGEPIPLGVASSAARPTTAVAQPVPAGESASAPATAWHALSVEDVAERLDVRPAVGLTTPDVKQRWSQWGLNRFAEPPEPALLGMFASQFLNAPSALLGAGTVLSIATGGIIDAVLIAGVLVVNAAMGTLTERRGQRAIKALRRTMAIRARVRRDGAEAVIDAEELVPGDVILLRPGDPVPADARLVSTEHLRVEESALTGESRPVAKRAPACAPDVPLADRSSIVYRGTTVAGGHATALVVATGEHTEYGTLRALAAAAEAPPTPLERDLDALGRTVAVGSTGICGAVLGLSLWRGVGLLPAISTAVGLGVAAIPEALPTIATTVLAFGAGRMRRKGTLIRTLSATESLGSVTHVCADKTGTLTENRMAVRELYVEGRTVRVEGPALAAAGSFQADDAPVQPRDWPLLMEALRIGALCSDAELVGRQAGEVQLDGSATEGALLAAAAKAGLDVRKLRAAEPILDRRDRNESRRYMVTVHRRGGRLVALMKGSPEAVLALCDRVASDSSTEPLHGARRATLDAVNADMSSRAMRVLGLAERELPEPYDGDDLHSGFTWYGLVGLVDPIRPQVPAAIQALHRAGIRTIMITGDQALTATAVARELGLSRRGVLNTIEASDLTSGDPEQLRELVREVSIFARIPPEMKLSVVRALQANGKIVAMTGDGVNDAPALRAADVGVAMGEHGSELARELADVVLSRDDLGQMVDAVEEGRLVRANVQRVLHYLLATNAAEVWAVLGATAIGLPSPLNPLQLLWLNLVTDVAPALALAVEPRDPTLMERPPRPPDESIVARPFLLRIVAESAPMALAALAVYGVGLRRYGPGPAAQSMAFASLVTAQLLHAPLARVGDRPATVGGRAPNRWLTAALGLSAGLQLAALFFPPLRLALGGAALRLPDLLICAGGALAAVTTLEAERLLRYVGARPVPALASNGNGAAATA